MKNHGLFSSLFIEELKEKVALDDAAKGRMATLAQAWQNLDTQNVEILWGSFLKQSVGYLEFVPPNQPDAPGVYPLYENWNYNECICVLYLAPPGSNIDDTTVGRFYPAKLLAHLKKRKLNWGILTDGAHWRLYSTKSARPYEDYVELNLAETLESVDDSEYGLFERFFHKNSFTIHRIVATPEINRTESEDAEEDSKAQSLTIEKCPLDQYREQSEMVLGQYVKEPLLAQVDEVLQYICNGFIFDTQKSGEEYTEEERADIFESAVKLIYRCLFLFYAEARRLLPTDPNKADLYRRHSIQVLCLEARKFRWGKRQDVDQYDLWKHLKGLINAVNDGDPEYGIMGYNGGLFDDEEEQFLGKHQLRNDFLSRALYLLAYVEPYDNEPSEEYAIPYEDLEVRHLGELYENILEFTVQLSDADCIRRRTKKGMEILLASQTLKKAGDTLIKKGEVYFGESALERKQTGSYYTAESLVRFLNEKTIILPLGETFERRYRRRFNDFLEQAIKGHDTGTRRGAAQSAAALIERFAAEEVLNFKVCDPAMGSGHFLVDASNQMAGLIVSLLEEVPYVEGLSVSVTSHPNYWRRSITRHCLYGVDLNPLAVNLAKLSLWLNCFASEHKLTFLDHHLRCGNSLIGIRSLAQLASIPERKNDRKKSGNQKLLFDYNDLSSVIAGAAKGVASITGIDEDDTDNQRAILDEAKQATSDVSYLADLYTAYLMDSNITTGIYKELFERLAKGKSAINSLNSTLGETLECVGDYQNYHNYYHWPLEFPDVFGLDTAGGFSATVGNPPWDIVKPNSQEFFSDYDPKFRTYGKQEANRISQKLMADNPLIAEKWQKYCSSFSEQSSYFKEPLSYNALGGGDINTYKLFLEQLFTLLKDSGHMGIVVPSGIYTDQGCQPLRELFLNYSQIDFLYCFENRWPTVFSAVDSRFKFVIFGSKKGGMTDRFNCAFMEHNPELLPIIDARSFSISVDQIKKFSPDTLSIMEFKHAEDILITAKIYGKWLLVGNQNRTNKVDLSYEYHMSGDSHLFRDQVYLNNLKCMSVKGKYWISGLSDLHTKMEKLEIKDIIKAVDSNAYDVYVPMYEGKQIWFFDGNFSNQQYWISCTEAKDYGKKLTYQDGSYSFERPRWGFRKIAAGTNERTLVVSLLPAYVFHGENIICNENNIDTELVLVELSCMSSFVLDFVLRNKVSATINMFPVMQLPFPEPDQIKSIKYELISRSLRLICVSSEYSSLWNKLFIDMFSQSNFWYPDPMPIYGPAHEQEIRRRLRDEAKNLTPDWRSTCGVHDRLQDRRDAGDRAQLRAEIDAYVAHLYGLSHDDFAYILNTFPVLKRKEEKAFGEFISKRKCLEEYDRLMLVMGEKK